MTTSENATENWLKNYAAERDKKEVERSSKRDAEFEGVVLESDNDIDYSKLQILLSKKRYRQADKLTYDLMCKAIGKSVGSDFVSEDIEYFPDNDLLSIDKLWSHYSDGYLGFSAQKEVLASVHNNLSSFQMVTGWRKYIFEDQSYPTDGKNPTTIAKGALPYLCNSKGKVMFIKNQIIVTSFVERLDEILMARV